MNPIVESLNFYLAVAGICAFLFSGILFYDAWKERALASRIQKYGLLMALVVSGVATVFSLIYSDVFGFVPCGLCWLERIFLYPQMFILLGALYFKDTLAARYGLILSIPGAIVAFYHHYIQMGGSEVVRCPSAGTIDCAKRIMFEFDFVTFPLLAAAGFVLLSALYFYILRTR